VNELALLESRALRTEHVGRVDVLDRVKALSLLPDGVHADIPIVAAYYEVSTGTIESLVRRNREELEGNGLRVLKGEEYKEFATASLKIANSKARSTTLFNRRAILNVGQLLEDSKVAKKVRAYLLNLEEIATHEQRSQAVDMVELSRSRVQLLAAAVGYLDEQWIKTKMRIQIAIGLGEEPEIDPDDVPLYVPDFLKSKGLKKKDIDSEQSWFGKRAASLYEAEHGSKPGRRESDLPNGSIRNTLAWTQRDLPIFEEVWDRWYAAKYAIPEEFALFGAES
jgi:hypothetical protein